MANTVAVVGASCDRRKYGNKSVRAHRKLGYTVDPIHPHEHEIEGLPAYRELAQVPGPVDRITMYVPPHVGIQMLDQIAAKQPKEFFLNPGSGSPELLARAREMGLDPIEACSILDLGEDPDQIGEDYGGRR
jgi:predicted CoA-binding protein